MMRLLSMRSKQRGFTLIEVGIALTIGLVIIMGVARGIQAAQERSVIAQVMDDVQIMGLAHEDLVSASHSLDGGSGFLDQDSISFDWVGFHGLTGVPSSSGPPWGGKYTADLQERMSSLVITVPEVPENIADQLSQRMRSLGTVTPVDSGLQITFSRYGDSNT